MPVSPIQADVTVGQNSALPPVSAVWTVNAEEKYSSATILGAEAKVFRHPKTGNFHGEIVFHIPRTDDSPEDAEDGTLRIRPQLHDCANLIAAQKMCEIRVREWLAQCRPEYLASLDTAEHEAAVEAQGEDPF